MNDMTNYYRLSYFYRNNEFIIKPYSSFCMKDKNQQLFQNIVAVPDFFIKKNEDIVFQENDIKFFSLDNYSSSYQFKIVYEYYFLKMIHLLINNNLINYYWDYVNIKNISNNLDDIYIKYSNKFLNNEYSFFNNPANLGKHILKNGMYLPFLVEKEVETEKTLIKGGLHRYYSLYLNKPEKKFLFFSVPNNLSPFCLSNKGYLDKEITSIIAFNNNGIFYQKQNDIELLLTNFIVLLDCIAEHFYDCQDIVKPLYLLNNEKEFFKFINNDFKIINAFEPEGDI